MDFARIDSRADAERGATLHLLNPYTDEPLFKGGLAITISLLGLDSTTGRRAVAEIGRQTERGKSKKKSVDIWDNSVDGILNLAAQGEQHNAELFAAITTGWANIDYLDDVNDLVDEPKELVFNALNAVKLYKTRTWIAEQVANFLGDNGNFAPNDNRS